jgi:HEAT repeat protein
VNAARLFLFFVLVSPGLCLADEASHKGRPVHLWLEDLLGDNQDKRESAERELKVIGTNALPTLYRYVTSSDSAFSSHNSSIVYRAFQILGPTAIPAIPKLVQLADDPNYTSDAVVALQLTGTEAALPLSAILTNQNPSIRQKVLDVLRHYAYQTNSIPRVQAVLPAVRACLADTNTLVSTSARVTLIGLSTNVNQLVVDIIPGLQSPSPEIRAGTAVSLRMLGTRATAAIPGLLKAANDESKNVRDEVALAIQAIDPRAAKKAGVKVPVYE